MSHPMAILVPMEFEAAIAPLAARQHALVTLGQVEALGFPRHYVDARVLRGALRRVKPGVFAVSGAPRTWEQSVLAAVLAAGPEAVASHTTRASCGSSPTCSERRSR